MEKGFTLIEVVVVIVIMIILSAVIMFSVNQYINKGKDSNVAANLSVLMPAGEIFYRANNSKYAGEGEADFCNPDTSNVFKNSISQMPINSDGPCYGSNPAGVCCTASEDAWVACARQFTDTSRAYCVDSRGVKKEINNSDCIINMTPLRCPDQQL